MLLLQRRTTSATTTTTVSVSRWIHASSLSLSSILIHKQPPSIATPTVSNKPRMKIQDEKPKQLTKRNELGVQLLSRPLHAQLFPGCSSQFPAPNPACIRIAREHLQTHGLDPTQGSVLSDTSFTLPPLQGRSLDEHFHRLGTTAAHPWLDISKSFAAATLPPQPEEWNIHSGWTKYYHCEDGSSFYEHVPFPDCEEALCFDVETMPAYHPYAVMATAASSTAWYAWVSPWLLGESEDPRHLIPFGPTSPSPSQPRVIVGHNISYDRARILDEYTRALTHPSGSQTRFVDTMALHIAVKGISSHQRPAWMKHRKNKEMARIRGEEAVQAVEAVLEVLREKEGRPGEGDNERRVELQRMRREIEESLPQLRAAAYPTSDSSITISEDDDEPSASPSKRWEDLTSANSLADVALLHCSITLPKDLRDSLMTSSRSSILASLPSYLSYCATDVSTTHAVFQKVLPAFLERCPSPVSFAGVLTMGSSFLTVDEGWEKYLKDAEGCFRGLEESVKGRLKELAEKARREGIEEGQEDPWLNQLDWTLKIASKSRGVGIDGSSKDITPTVTSTMTPAIKTALKTIPAWYSNLLTNGLFQATNINRILPLLLKLECDGVPLEYDTVHGWHYKSKSAQDEGVLVVMRLPTAHESKSKVLSPLNLKHGVKSLQEGRMRSLVDTKLALAIARGDRSENMERRVGEIANDVVRTLEESKEECIRSDPWLRQLDWKAAVATPSSDTDLTSPPKSKPKSKAQPKAPQVLWPKWYWDLTKPKKGMPPGTLDITVRSRIAPILLRLSWLGWPLFHSREHGWTFRVSNTDTGPGFETRQTPLHFYDPADDKLQEMRLRGGFDFYKLPHKDGEQANVGNPLAKTFMKYAQDGTLTSPGDEAREALDMNAQCSYWISARDRILGQHVVWQDGGVDLGIKCEEGKKWGIIIPQVITMGTVTRRAIEKTWLTASNAKKNRVGSELKAMVRAPDGYAIVGADVDSEELWISSCMGDAQFGMHGATAIGWMTLEGTKAAGTDLHSKTASILGISRDQAKVFNYSRIYGAGMRHAVLLLLQSNAGMLPEQAQKLAENLYASTKGKSTHRTDMFGRKFWFGGTESYLFNKLEEIALSDRPQTPALGCGITDALSKEFLPPGFGTDYMTSRINWVVQSSGVDYLHLLVVSMDHLIAKYDIKARYLISVHDELRYLVTEDDKYRAALALQIANLWTRCLFAYKLGMDDLPQGVAFFSAVDVDKVLRKEVDMPCVTPSQPNPIPSGESLNIAQILERTNGGSLWVDGRSMADENNSVAWTGPPEGYQEPDCLKHRAKSPAFLRAQATTEFAEVKHLAQMEHGQKFEGGIGGPRRSYKNRGTDNIPKSLTNVEGVDWNFVNEVLKSAKLPTARRT